MNENGRVNENGSMTNISNKVLNFKKSQHNTLIPKFYPPYLYCDIFIIKVKNDASTTATTITTTQLTPPPSQNADSSSQNADSSYTNNNIAWPGDDYAYWLREGREDPRLITDMTPWMKYIENYKYMETKICRGDCRMSFIKATIESSHITVFQYSGSVEPIDLNLCGFFCLTNLKDDNWDNGSKRTNAYLDLICARDFGGGSTGGNLLNIVEEMLKTNGVQRLYLKALVDPMSVYLYKKFNFQRGVDNVDIKVYEDNYNNGIPIVFRATANCKIQLVDKKFGKKASAATVAASDIAAAYAALGLSTSEDEEQTVEDIKTVEECNFLSSVAGDGVEGIIMFKELLDSPPYIPKKSRKALNFIKEIHRKIFDRVTKSIRGRSGFGRRGKRKSKRNPKRKHKRKPKRKPKSKSKKKRKAPSQTLK